MKQSIVTLDMEGVLTPEIWIAVAEKTKIPELRRTTRDEPDYDRLMRGRLEILARHNLKLSDIQNVIASLKPLEGAQQFLSQLRSLVQVIILSDTFEQFAAPLMQQLNQPTLFCHKLVVENDRIVDYLLRTADQKKKTVTALKRLNYYVVSAGDSYNDTGMLLEANKGFLIHAPDNVKRDFPQFKAVESHGELLREIRAEISDRDIKLTLSAGKSIELEKAHMRELGALRYPLGNRPLRSGPGTRVYFILDGRTVARATIAKFQKLTKKEHLRDYEGKDIWKPGWWMTCMDMELARSPVESLGFQGFRYVQEDERLAFEAAFA